MHLEQDQPGNKASGRISSAAKGFMVRLAKDTSGNVLAITAATVIPMIGMVGSGIDIGRTYLVKTRLQQACDAGVLAARKSISGNALDQPARDQGQKFFTINLKTGMYGSEDVTFQLSDVMRRDPVTNTDVATGTVHGAADATVPMTLMKIFGKADIDLSTTCEAELNVANNDIMFVLDVTGSMACLPTDDANSCDSYVYSNTPTGSSPPGGYWKATEKSGSRISALRSAVKAFFNTVDTARAPGTRLRIGFVPYASGVDVSGLSLPSSGTNANYVTREANFNTAKHVPSTGAWSSWGNDQTFGAAITTANCDNYGNNVAFTQSGNTFSPNPSGNPAPAAPTTTVTGGAKPADVVSTQYRRKSWTGTNATNKTCVRELRTATTTYTTRWGWTNWTYKTVSMPYTAYKTGVSYVRTATSASMVATQGSYDPLELAAEVTAGTTTGLTNDTTAWDGCVEEDGSSSILAATWWPAWRDITFGRNGSAAESNSSADDSTPFWRAAQNQASLLQTSYACPKPAQRLQVMTQTSVNAYVDAADFVPLGYTYHDIGMLWGARLMATNGIFAADHGAAPNGRPVARHIVFMTDGDMKPQSRAYGPYGIEAVLGRANGSPTTNDTTLKAVHNTRFLAACTAAKNNGVSIWVVAFGQSLTTELTNCASSTTQTFQAANSTQLNQAFAQIAQRIADLRLVG